MTRAHSGFANTLLTQRTLLDYEEQVKTFALILKAAIYLALAAIWPVHSRAGVMLNGKWRTQPELNDWLDQAAKAISTSFKEH